MGSRSRRSKALKRLTNELGSAEAAHKEVRIKRHKRDEVKRATKPAWVRQIEASGHQYITGDRAPVIALTRPQRTMNKRERKARQQQRPTQVTQYGVKRRVSVETGKVFYQEPISRTVPNERVRTGESTPESSQQAVDHTERLLSGRTVKHTRTTGQRY